MYLIYDNVSKAHLVINSDQLIRMAQYMVAITTGFFFFYK